MKYKNLIGEIAKAEITKKELAEMLGIHWNSISNKLSGESSFTVDEAIKIRDCYFRDSLISYLFKRED